MPGSGTVFIGEDFDHEDFSMWSGRWSAYWGSADGEAAREELRGVSASEAIAWGRARAEVVLIRPGGSVVHYSAGRRHPGGEDLPVWPEGKELQRRRDPHQAYLDRPADSPPIVWRVGYGFMLAIEDLAQFTQHYRLSLERDETIEAVTGTAEIEGVEIKGDFTMRASTSAEAREKAIEAIDRAREAAWGSTGEAPKDAFWVSLIDDPKPVDDPPPSAAVVLPDGLATPSTVAEAEAWIELAVAWFGPRFHPESAFREYRGVRVRQGEAFLDLSEEQEDQLDAALQAAKQLLGSRVGDLAYRSADAYLAEIDIDWSEWARPVSQPPARWWLIERDEQGATSPAPRTDVAYEDEKSTWWIWEPATRQLHCDEPWLFTDYYYRARAHRGQFIDTGYEQIRFTPLTPDEAKSMIGSKRVGGASDQEFLNLRKRDEHARDPYTILSPVD